MRTVHLGLADDATDADIVKAIDAKNLNAYNKRDRYGKLVGCPDPTFSKNIAAFAKGHQRSNLAALVDDFDEIVGWQY